MSGHIRGRPFTWKLHYVGICEVGQREFILAAQRSGEGWHGIGGTCSNLLQAFRSTSGCGGGVSNGE